VAGKTTPASSIDQAETDYSRSGSQVNYGGKPDNTFDEAIPGKNEDDLPF